MVTIKVLSCLGNCMFENAVNSVLNHTKPSPSHHHFHGISIIPSHGRFQIPSTSTNPIPQTYSTPPNETMVDVGIRHRIGTIEGGVWYWGMGLSANIVTKYCHCCKHCFWEISLYTRICIYVCMCTYTYVYIYICIYLYTQNSKYINK